MISTPNASSSFLTSLALIFCFAMTAPGQQPQSAEANPANLGPLVEDWNPKTGSVNSVIELKGYRVYTGDLNRTKAFFIQSGVELPARIKGGSWTTNDANHGAQSVDIIVPEEALPGPGQIVVEMDGHRSAPVTLTIAEWKLPVITGIRPTRGAPGIIVGVDCEGFHIDDELEITDVEGRPFNFHPGGSSSGTAFGIPKDAPEGIINIRIGNKKYGKGQYTEPFPFVVTNEPLPPELTPWFMKSVAPGQWLDLQSSHPGPFTNSERTEVAFKQAGREIIVTLPKPFRPHVAVPSALSPGEVEFQVRTWRNDQPSAWSDWTVFTLADKAVAPLISAIRLKDGNWVQLSPGPDRQQSFTVSPGSELVFNGIWPVADASDLKVTLVRPGSVVALTAAELNENADWFCDLVVRLPKAVEPGKWRMIMSSETDGTHTELPIIIRVLKK